MLRVPRPAMARRWAMLAALAVAAVAVGVFLVRGQRVQAQAADAPAASSAESPAAPDAGAAPMADSSGKLDWGTDYLQWTPVTGYVLSRSHGSRLALVRVTPLAAAQLRARNAEALRHLQPGHVKAYPEGTRIAMETWEIGPDESRGAPGPIFFMKKEAPGYDPQGGDWRYGMTRADLSVLADGKDGRSTECRTCHLRMKARDYVPAMDR